MATVMGAPGMPMSNHTPTNDNMARFRDPRSPGDQFPSPQKTMITESSPHPDLNMEVASLSNKLISAINHQTHLDDALAATRQELEATQSKVLRLDVENREYKLLIANGDLVGKAELDSVKTQLLEERKRRQAIEKEKQEIDAELENLSAALFEEANQVRLITLARNPNTNEYRWLQMLVKRPRPARREMISSSNRYGIRKYYWHRIKSSLYS